MIIVIFMFLSNGFHPLLLKYNRFAVYGIFYFFNYFPFVLDGRCPSLQFHHHYHDKTSCTH